MASLEFIAVFCVFHVFVAIPDASTKYSLSKVKSLCLPPVST